MEKTVSTFGYQEGLSGKGDVGRGIQAGGALTGTARIRDCEESLRAEEERAGAKPGGFGLIESSCWLVRAQEEHGDRGGRRPGSEGL